MFSSLYTHSTLHLYLDMAVIRAFMLHLSVVIPHSCRGHQGNMARLLKRATVLAIRKQYDAGYTITEIAKSLGRSQSSIADVCHRRTYQRVKDLPDVPRLRMTEEAWARLGVQRKAAE